MASAEWSLALLVKSGSLISRNSGRNYMDILSLIVVSLGTYSDGLEFREPGVDCWFGSYTVSYFLGG